MKKIAIFWSAIGILIVIGILIFIPKTTGPGEFDAFAQCLADKETKFYGAFWCPHCQTQHRLFGASDAIIKESVYIECSNPNRSQNTLCQEAGIQGYPTWEFGDGTRLTNTQELSVLAEYSGCPLPTDEDTVNDTEPLEEENATDTTDTTENTEAFSPATIDASLESSSTEETN